MLPVLEPAQMRGNHRADRPLISGAIGRAANVPENRTDVQTCTAPYAVQSIPLFRIGQKLSSPVVQKDNMKLLRSVGLARLTRSAHQRVITSQLLSCASNRKHRQKKRKIAELR